MFAYEPSLNPPYNPWEDHVKPEKIENLIQEACRDILKHHADTRFKDIFVMMHEYFEEKVLQTEEDYE